MLSLEEIVFWVLGCEELLSKKEQIDGTRAESQQIVAQGLLS